MKKTNPGAALAAALLLALVAVSCDRDRSNPLDPQADFVQNRPEAPAQLVAEPGVGVIRLAWQGVTDRDLAGYALFRSERSNGTYAFVPGDGDSTAGITTGKVVFADSIHTQNRTFFYRIAAIDTAGLQSELTAFVGATALEDNIAPESPQSLSAVPDEDVLGRVVLRWSAPQKDSDGRDLSGLSGYVILRAEAGTGGVVPIDTLVAGIREFVDNDLKTLTTYSYSMVAFDVGGNTSRPATAVQVTTPGLPTPKSVNAADGIGRIVVTWGAVEDEALIGYDIYRSVSSEDGYVRLAGAEGRSFTTGRTTYIDSGLTGGALFFYRVRAVGRAGAASELSTFVSGEAQADEVPPGVPANLSAVPDAADFGRITVSWNVPQRDASGGVLTGLAGYAVFRSQETTDSFVRIATVTDPSFVDTGLDESTTFYYTVAAFDEKGNESGRASAVRVRTQGEDRIGPDAPVNVSAVADESTTGRIIVRWSAPTTDSDGQELTGLSGFVLFRSEGGPGSFVPADTVGADIRLWPDADLKSLTLYAYTVVAFDAAGNESRPATSSQTTTGGIPAPQGRPAHIAMSVRILSVFRQAGSEICVIFVLFALHQKGMGQNILRQQVPGLALQRSPCLSLGFFPFVQSCTDLGTCGIRQCQVWIQTHRFLGAFLRQSEPLLVRQQQCFLRVEDSHVRSPQQCPIKSLQPLFVLSQTPQTEREPTEHLRIVRIFSERLAKKRLGICIASLRQ